MNKWNKFGFYLIKREEKTIFGIYLSQLNLSTDHKNTWILERKRTVSKIIKHNTIRTNNK